MNLAERLGYAPDERVLILNADDVGSSHASNLATFECVENGSLTSASLLAPAPWFPEAAAYARAHPDVDFGVHLTLTCEYTGYRWRALADRATSPGLYDDEGYLWRTMNEAVEHVSVEEAERELRAQIDTALAAGVDVTHIDTHMGTVVMPKFIGTYISLALEYGIPLFAYRPSQERLRQAGLGHFWDGLEPQLRRLDEAGFPVLDHILTKTTDQPPESKEAYVRDLFANVRPGLGHFLIHPTTVSEEVAAVTENVESRVKDYELFRDRSMANLLAELGIHTTTYRQIREAYRTGALKN
ncbi:MAG: polysaccharide deacetylase family protein [Chloroflexi bacterium]|nr:polysaccharide deacetylase family protein [Chloroflexota bacterium]